MEKEAPNCGVCLTTGPDLQKLTELDSNNRLLLSKLRFCVPEIQWRENYTICAPCITELDLVYKFRKKCLSSENLRNQKIPKKITRDKSQAKNAKPFVCHLCNNRFGCSSNLTEHLKYHSGERPHVCTFCGKAYITKTDLSNHEKIHLNKREYKCDQCPKCFNTHKDLRSHKLVVHTDPSLWQHVCDVCSKRFPIKSNFDAHMRRHKNERPFECHLCDKKFTDKCILKKHFLSHTNNRQFTCDICRKEYKDKRVMEIHKRRIHGIGNIKVPERVKKYLCHMCPKAYFEKNKLTRHLCSHTGEKPFFCTLCQKKFVDKSYLKQHLRKSHNMENEEI